MNPSGNKQALAVEAALNAAWQAETGNSQTTVELTRFDRGYQVRLTAPIECTAAQTLEDTSSNSTLRRISQVSYQGLVTTKYAVSHLGDLINSSNAALKDAHQLDSGLLLGIGL